MGTENTIEVCNLYTDQWQTFVNLPVETALINAAILDENPSQLHSPRERERYSRMIQYGKRTIGLGDYCVLVR